MSTKEAPRQCGNTDRAVMETAAFDGAATSYGYFSTVAAGRQSGFIASLLMYGPENGLTLKDLERITDWPERAIRKAIESERRAGALIISNNRNGYYLTSDPGEAQVFTRSMRHRAHEILRTAAAVERAAGLD